MKKLMLIAVFAFSLILTSCGSDDDGNSNCRECANGAVSIELCDLGNGTYSINGEGAIEIPADSSFDEVFELSCTAIGAGL